MSIGKRFFFAKLIFIPLLLLGVLVSCTPAELNDYLNDLTGLGQPESIAAVIEETVQAQHTQNSIIATQVAEELQTKTATIDSQTDRVAVEEDSSQSEPETNTAQTQQSDNQETSSPTEADTGEVEPSKTAEPTNTPVVTSTPLATSEEESSNTKTLTPTASKTLTKTPTSEKIVLNPTNTKTKAPTLTPSKTKVSTNTPTKTTQPTTKPTNTAIPTTAPTNTPQPQNTATFTPVPPTPTTAPSGCNWSGNSGFESSLISLINAERSNRGLSTLSQNSALTTAARGHSQDMACNNFFSHTGSDGSSPFSRMIAAGYSYSRASENIYAGSGGYNSASSAFSSWMNSDGHRTNMLDPNVTHIGIGYAYNENSDYGGYVTANFGAP